MLKTTILFCSLFVGILNAQTFEEINQDNELIKTYNWKSKEDSKHILELFSCLKKKYKYDYKQDAFFNKIVDHSIYNIIFFSDYNTRLEMQRKYSKCVKRSEVDY